MNAKVHRALTAALASLTAIAGIWAATDASGLGIDQQTAAWIAFGLSIGTVVVTAIREAVDPTLGSGS